MGAKPAVIASWGVFVAALSLADPARAQFLASAPRPISEINPFADCSAGVPGLFTLNAEVEPWIATNPTDPENIVVTWQQDRGRVASARGLVVGVSLDGGRSWESVVVPGLSFCSGDRVVAASDPWVSFGPNGDLYHIALIAKPIPSAGFLGSAIVVNKSIDGGLTWSDPITIHESGGLEDDKESITADPTDERFIYAVWSKLSGAGTFFTRTTDGGQTWEPARFITFAGTGHQILVLPDGALILAMKSGEFLWIQHSSDRGATWSPAGGALPVLAIPGVTSFTPGIQQVRSAEQLFDIAVDRHNGSLYLVWQGSQAAIGPQVMFSMSLDGGFSWSEPAAIARTPPSPNFFLSQSFLPSVHVNDDGVVGVTYYDFRNDDAGSSSLTDHWFIHCDPAIMNCTDAASWQEIRITASSFDYEEAPITRGGLFLGDYVGLTSAGRHFLTAFPQSSSSDPATVFFSRIASRTEAEIDIKPGSAENVVNVTSNGVIRVAVLGSDSLHVAEVDATALAFGPAGAAPVHSHRLRLEDVDNDGVIDLLAHYATRETGIAIGDTEACVSGELLDGTLFGGCDDIRTVTGHGPKCDGGGPC